MLAKRQGTLFAYSNWDIIPVIAGLLHLAYVVALFLLFPYLPWWALLPLGGIYAVAISWNINGVSHNFIHNPYFNAEPLNYAFSLIESWAIGFSQIFYHWVHNRHHSGNSDMPGEDGSTVDWLSIYRYGKDGQPENVWKYTFASFFRDDPVEIYREVKRQKPFNAKFGLFEAASYVTLVIGALIFDWKAIAFLAPFYYLGNCLSSLNGYYEHLGGNPDVPIAWGVSCYNRFYNWLWFNNGYHAEHHYRPRQHWTTMRELHLQLQEKQLQAGVRVIGHAHALGFMEPQT